MYLVEPGDPSAPDVAKLLGESEAYANSLYPVDGVHMLPIENLQSEEVHFKVVRDAAGLAIACGAILSMPEGWAEVKRMYVATHARNRGLGLVLLGHLETLAARCGARFVRLETGPLQTEALRLYRSNGYSVRGPFGSYQANPSSVFMEKSLLVETDADDVHAFPAAYVDLGERIGRYDRVEERADELIERLGLGLGARVLDVPCGAGHFSAALHRRGCSVVGIDLSAQQIDRARQLFSGPDYRVGDMRDRADGPFDAIVNLFSSFGYFARVEDDLAVLRQWYEGLRPGGHLVIETTDRARVRALVDPHRASVVIHAPDFLVETRVDADFRRLVTRYEHRGRHLMTCPIRIYAADELAGLCQAAGFAQIEKTGGLGGSPRTEVDRLVVFARRTDAVAVR
jgi:SAM-dependent methyltransferase/GNAT superfamily N-acetyltransferase